MPFHQFSVVLANPHPVLGGPPDPGASKETRPRVAVTPPLFISDPLLVNWSRFFCPFQFEFLINGCQRNTLKIFSCAFGAVNFLLLSVQGFDYTWLAYKSVSSQKSQTACKWGGLNTWGATVKQIQYLFAPVYIISLNPSGVDSRRCALSGKGRRQDPFGNFCLSGQGVYPPP